MPFVWIIKRKLVLGAFKPYPTWFTYKIPSSLSFSPGAHITVSTFLLPFFTHIAFTLAVFSSKLSTATSLIFTSTLNIHIYIYTHIYIHIYAYIWKTLEWSALIYMHTHKSCSLLTEVLWKNKTLFRVGIWICYRHPLFCVGYWKKEHSVSQKLSYKQEDICPYLYPSLYISLRNIVSIIKRYIYLVTA